VVKKFLKMALMLALLIGGYLGYVRVFAVVVGRLTAARRVDDFRFIVKDSQSKREAIKQARESFGPEHWTAVEDLQLRYYNSERGFWMYSQHDDRVIEEDGIRYDGKRMRLRPAAIIWRTKDGSSTKTITSEEAIIDFNQPLSLNANADAQPIVVKHARLERNVMIRDDKGTPADRSDDMIVGPMNWVEYDDDKLQIRSDSNVLIVDGDTRITGIGMLIQLRPKAEPVPGGRSAGFEGAQHAQLNSNVDVVFKDIGKTGFLPGTAQTKKTASGKVEVKAQVDPHQGGEKGKAAAEPVPLDAHCDGPMLAEFPKPHLPVKVGPPAPAAPTMVHFTRNVVVRRGKPTEQPDRLDSDNLDLTLVPEEKPAPTKGQASPTGKDQGGAEVSTVAKQPPKDGEAGEAKEPHGMFGDLTLRRVKATGHAVWLSQPLRGAKIACNEMIHVVAPEGGQNVTNFLVDSKRKHWLLEKYDFVEERPEGPEGPVRRVPQSVTYVWATDATLYDTGGDMDRSNLFARGPGRMETRPVPTDAAASVQGVPADRIVTWQNQLTMKNEIRPQTKVSERVLILTGKPWIFDRTEQSQSTLNAADTVVAWLEPKPKAAQSPPTRSTASSSPAPTTPGSEDGGYQIRRLLALNDAHLVAPSKNLTARQRLDADFVPAPKPEAVVTRSTAPGPVEPGAGPTAAAPAGGPDAQAENKPPEQSKPAEPNMIAVADSVEATIVVVSSPEDSRNKSKPTGKAGTRTLSSAANPGGDPDSTYEVRDARLFGRVRLHQDPSPGKTKGQDASGEALILHNEGPGKAIFNLFHRDPRVKLAAGASPPRMPLAEVITDDQTIKGERIGVNQNTDEAWVYGPGQLIQLTDRNLMTDKTEETPAQDPDKAGGEAVAAKDAKQIKAKPRTRAGKVQTGRVPLVITWQEKMLFHGRSVDPENRPSAKAEFFKEVWAFMDDGELYSRDKMTTYTDKPIPLADLGKMNQKKTAAGGANAGQMEGEDGGKAEEPKPDLTLIHLVGQAHAISRKVDPDRPIVLSQQVVLGDTINYDRRTGDFEVPSAGWVYLYDRGDNTAMQPDQKPDDDVATRRPIRRTSGKPEDRPRKKAAEPAKKETIKPLILTQIRFKREMRGRFGTGRETDKTEVRWANFFGDIETARAVVPNLRTVFSYDHLPPDAYFLTSQTMRVVTEPPPPGSPANAPARNFLKAWEHAIARTSDTTISADVITYDSRSDLMYANGEEGRLVNVVKQKGVGQQGSPTVAEALRVNPKTGESNLIGPHDLQWVDARTGTRPNPLPPPDPNAKPAKPKNPLYKPQKADIERRGYTGQ
jgi:hypothetical protein